MLDQESHHIDECIDARTFSPSERKDFLKRIIGQTDDSESPMELCMRARNGELDTTPRSILTYWPGNTVVYALATAYGTRDELDELTPDTVTVSCEPTGTKYITGKEHDEKYVYEITLTIARGDGQ